MLLELLLSGGDAGVLERALVRERALPAEGVLEEEDER